MSVRFLVWLFLLASLFSCSKEGKEEAPLTRDQMVSLMMDVYLAEARTTLLPIHRDSAYRLFLPYQDSLLRRHGIADSTLKKAYGYYLRHPAAFESIYDAIIDSLSLREQKMRENPAHLRKGK